MEESLVHHVIYGAPGGPAPTKRVIKSKSGRKVLPMVAPASVDWDVPVPAAALTRIWLGFTPKSMDDKWFIWADEGEEGGGAAPSADAIGVSGGGVAQPVTLNGVWYEVEEG